MAVALEFEDPPTTDRASARNRRIEVITGRERRRRWTAEQKREIAAESLRPGVSPIMVARRYGISSGLLYTWRQQLLCGGLGAVVDTKPRFVRVDVVAGHPQPELTVPITPLMSPTAELDGQIEIMLSNGAKVRVDAQVNEDALRRVLAALGSNDRRAAWCPGLSCLRHYGHARGWPGWRCRCSRPWRRIRSYVSGVIMWRRRGAAGDFRAVGRLGRHII